MHVYSTVMVVFIFVCRIGCVREAQRVVGRRARISNPGAHPEPSIEFSSVRLQ